MKAVASRLHLQARENNNPLRGLTLGRAVYLAESFPRGEFTDLMWTFGCPFNGIETSDPDLSIIIDRRTSALAEMDWNAKEKTGDKVDQALAQEQVAAVQELINGIDNLYDAIDHLAIAFNRGFAHCEIVEDYDGTPEELRPVDQWHVIRDGMYGGWRYNPDLLQTTFDSLSPDLDMPSDRFIFREVKRPAGRFALMKFVRSNLSESDWAAFTEIYGLRTGVVTMPPGADPNQEAEYLAAAQAVAEGGAGALPHGATYSPNSGDKGSGSGPFERQLKYYTEKMIMMGTNGLLTSLAAPGSGTLAGNAHADVFETLSRGDARKISEDLTRQLVNPFLEKRFPGQEICAYFELAFREEVDGSKIIEDAKGLKEAGFVQDPAELSEKVGYKVSRLDPEAEPGKNTSAEALRGPADASEENSPLRTPKNPERLSNREYRGFLARKLADIREMLSKSREESDREALSQLSRRLEKLRNRSPEKSNADKLAKVLRLLGFEAKVERESEWAQMLAEAVAEGIEGVDLDPDAERIENNCGTGKGGFQPGNKCGKSRARESKSNRTKPPTSKEPVEDSYHYMPKGSRPAHEVPAEKELRKFYGRTVKLSDGRTAEVEQYNIESGHLTVWMDDPSIERTQYVWWVDAEILEEES